MNERQRITGMIAMAFCACLVVGCGPGKSSQDDSASHDMTLMSYNVMHCAGIDDKVNIARTAEVIKRENPRFAGLQELDCKAAKRSFGVDQPAELGRLTGMHATFAQAIPFQGGGYGVAVLSREKPLAVYRAPLPGEIGRAHV